MSSSVTSTAWGLTQQRPITSASVLRKSPAKATYRPSTKPCARATRSWLRLRPVACRTARWPTATSTKSAGLLALFPLAVGLAQHCQFSVWFCGVAAAPPPGRVLLRAPASRQDAGEPEAGSSTGAYSTTQYSTVQHRTIQYRTIQCSTAFPLQLHQRCRCFRQCPQSGYQGPRAT